MTTPSHLTVPAPPTEEELNALVPPLPHYVDSTILDNYRACPRKNLFSYVHGLYPTGQSVHLIAGGALAAGMEAARRRTFTAPDPFAVTLDDQLESAFIAFAEEWGDFQPPDNHPKNFINTFSALRYYLEHYPPAHDPIQPLRRADGSPAIEYTFSIPLPVLHPDGEPMFYVGRFDMLGLYSVNNISLPCILDDKSTYSLGYSWADSWDLRGQFVGYIWVCREHGINLSHAAVRGITIQKTQNEIRTALPEFPLHTIERWHNMMIADVQDIVDKYKRYRNACSIFPDQQFDPDGYTYRYNLASACGSYGGCAFATLCKARNPANYVSNYILHRWNPLAKNPVQEVSK